MTVGRGQVAGVGNVWGQHGGTVLVVARDRTCNTYTLVDNSSLSILVTLVQDDEQ